MGSSTPALSPGAEGSPFVSGLARMTAMKTTDLFIFYWARVFAQKGRATRFLGRRELHELHPG
jgi:hypothetical protein